MSDPPTLHPPPREEVPPHLNFAPFDNAADALAGGAALSRCAAEGVARRHTLGHSRAGLNQKLMQSERRLTTEEGILRRGWYKHMIYVPGVYSGYGAKTVAGVREAIEQKHWDEANAEIVRVSAVLNNETALINSAAAELEQAKPGSSASAGTQLACAGAAGSEFWDFRVAERPRHVTRKPPRTSL